MNSEYAPDVAKELSEREKNGELQLEKAVTVLNATGKEFVYVSIPSEMGRLKEKLRSLNAKRKFTTSLLQNKEAPGGYKRTQATHKEMNKLTIQMREVIDEYNEEVYVSLPRHLNEKLLRL